MSLDSRRPAPHPASNIYLHKDAEVWERSEIERLKDMDEFLAAIAEGDLRPLIDDITQRTPFQAKFFDIAAGTGSTTADLCAEKNMAYFALDANELILGDRETSLGPKILGKSEGLPVVDHAFDITYSRAATAWNKTPQQAIAEQIRVTAPGGYAVFTEFDWTSSGTDAMDEASRKLMSARSVMMQVLSYAGFDPGYGEVLGTEIDQTMTRLGVVGQRTEHIHEWTTGDYRGIFLSSAEALRKQLAELRPGLASRLQGYMTAVELSDGVNFRLPAIVTEIVQLS